LPLSKDSKSSVGYDIQNTHISHLHHTIPASFPCTAFYKHTIVHDATKSRNIGAHYAYHTPIHYYFPLMENDDGLISFGFVTIMMVLNSKIWY